jgi:hypothetical protein
MLESAKASRPSGPPAFKLSAMSYLPDTLVFFVLVLVNQNFIGDEDEDEDEGGSAGHRARLIRSVPLTPETRSLS